ncbi:MAG: ribonuclease R, partial [Dehalococcoidia bacterium]|nr:ribonuclease R [Dehalococcoidia bacterium]
HADMTTLDDLLERIRTRVDHPATVAELQQALRIPRDQRPAFQRRLKALVASGAMVRIRGNRYGLPDKMNLVVGRVQTNPRGFGFVTPEAATGADGDIYIAGANLNQAMHGDRVVTRLERRGQGGRAEGRIVRILERRAATLVGRYDTDESGLGFVVPFDRRIIMDVHVPAKERGTAARGDIVVVELTRWPTATRNPVGRVTEVLGDMDAPGVDIEIILRKHGIPDEHGAGAVREAEQLGAEVRDRDRRGRTDFRALTTVTIDGEHARDFDDAITLERLPNGHYWLGVHIADVSHYVRPGSELDREARERGTSVYFPERAVHMFPSALSTGLCSLNPHVDRLVQSCLMEVTDRGEVVRHELHDGIIHSDARMTYTEVSAIVAERDAATRERFAELVPLFELMHELFEVLARRRRRRGSIDFDLKEPEIVLDDAGLVAAITAAERHVAHRIIEEFMLLANEVVAEHLDAAEMPALYRVHDPPDLTKVAEFEEFITTLGYSLAVPEGRVTPKHFQRLVGRIRGTPEEKPIAFLMLRTMQKARYDPACIGHFGLAASSYTHFTSPIRRYPDLVVHRALRRLRAGKLPAARRRELSEALPELATGTSELERRAEEAERELMQWKKVRFMADKVGDEFEGYVIGVTSFGLFVELVEHFVEGLVHISSMADDYYRFVEREHVLFGEATGKTYRLGDRVQVQVVRVDPERRQVDLGVVEILEAVRASERNRGARRSRVKPKRETRGRRPTRERRPARARGRRRR